MNNELTDSMLVGSYKIKADSGDKKPDRKSLSLGKKGSGSLYIETNLSGVYFYYKYKKNGKVSLEPIGKHNLLNASSDGIGLNEAIKRATIFADHNLAGTLSEYLADVKAVKEQKKEREKVEKEEAKKLETYGSFEDLLIWYRDVFIGEERDSYSDIKSAFNKHIFKKRNKFKKLLLKKATDITSDDIKLIFLDCIEIEGEVRVYMNRLRSHLHAAFKAMIKQEGDYENQHEITFNIKFNPVGSIPRKGEVENRGKDQLTDKEIWIIWHHGIEAMNTHLGYLSRLLLSLGGVRQGQLMKAEWFDVDTDFKIPNIRVLNNKWKKGMSVEQKYYAVPLNKLALSDIKFLKEKFGEYKHLFPKKNGSSYKNEHMCKHLDKRTKALNRFIKDKINSDHFKNITIGMIRGSVTTRMKEAGCDEKTIMRLQAHTVDDDGKKIQNSMHHEVYSPDFQFLAEKLEVSNKWEKYLRNIIDKPFDQITDRLPEDMHEMKNIRKSK
ncbi:site-specific integrase [Endozoicomonas euniceicola]|uniref:Tyr recombinase domain-containing protein n=1 Tax=Endozoicomonas euniceicola TaxID=1234143 RepID=A0ABY6H0M1_9GAMM|nr:hypothetical protein [Endozoicomonas euniceicola]UYM18597.1 hypothetical protein NX720_12080 [Endozoicomonas euniceicola]